MWIRHTEAVFVFVDSRCWSAWFHCVYPKVGKSLNFTSFFNLSRGLWPCESSCGHVSVNGLNIYQYTNLYFMWVRQKVVQNQGNPPNKDTGKIGRRPVNYDFISATSVLVWFHCEHHWLSLMLHGTGTGWWFQIFFIFTPIWEWFPFWLIFFKGVETTN